MKWKKISIVWMCILLVSAAMVLAVDTEVSVSTNASVDASVSVEANSSRDGIGKELREELKDAREQVKEQRQDLREERMEQQKALNEERREMMKDIREKRKTFVEQMQDERKEMHEKFASEMRNVRNRTVVERKQLMEKMQEEREDLREELKEKRELLKKEAEDAREQLKASRHEDRVIGAQKMLTVTLDHAAAVLKDAETALEQSAATINDTAIPAQIGAKIDALQERMSALKDKIASLNNNSTKEEVKTLNNNVRDVLKDVKLLVRGVVSQHQIMHFRGVFEKLDQANERLTKLLERAEENGKDISSYQTSVGAIKQRLDSVKQLLFDAQTAKNAGDSAKAAQLLQSVQQEAKSTVQQIQELHASIKANLSVSVDANVDASASGTGSSGTEGGA